MGAGGASLGVFVSGAAGVSPVNGSGTGRGFWVLHDNIA